MKPLSRRVDSIKISATKMMPMIAARVGGCVSLGQGIPSFSTPAHVVAAVNEALGADSASGKYSLQPGMIELRRAIAAHLWEEKGLDVDPETQIGVMAGAMEALLGAILTLVDDGDEVIMTSPCYPSHIEQVIMAGGKPVFAPLLADDWQLDVEAVKKAVSPRTKAILINSPSNPCGTVFREDDLREVARIAVENDLYVITDETYDFLTFGGRKAFSLTSVPELRDRMIGIFSFSKKYALTGWRVGYCVASPEIMGEILKVHDCATICAPTPSQVAALAAMNGPQDIYEDFRRKLELRRDLICARLDRLPEHFSYVRPSGAFYVMARYLFTDMPSRKLAVKLVEEARVITIPGGSFGPTGEGHLRMSFGGREEEIDEAFDRIEAWIGKMG